MSVVLFAYHLFLPKVSKPYIRSASNSSLQMGRKSRARQRDRKKRKRTRSSSSSSSKSSRSYTPSPIRKKANKSVNSQVAGCYSLVLNSMVPEFDPLTDKVNNWLNIVDLHAKTFNWNDQVIIYQAVNKLKGTAKTWYDSFLKNESCWASWRWKQWRDKISFTFQTKRNMFTLLKEIIDSKPLTQQHLYEFYFQQKCKIDKLSVNFSDQDIISIITGNIDDPNISASVDAGSINTCDQLASFLHGRLSSSHNTSHGAVGEYKVPQIGNSCKSEQSNRIAVSNQSVTTAKTTKQITCFGCGGNHKRNVCTETCKYCSKKGHSENYCRNKKSDEVKKEVKLVKSGENKNKFNKIACIGGFSQKVFVDMGSDCSLITSDLVKQLKLTKLKLAKPVHLQGFSNCSVVLVDDYVTTSLILDGIKFESVDFYIINELSGCDVLIGRNVTEDTSVMYTRIGNQLTFQKTVNVSAVLSSEVKFNVPDKYCDALKDLFNKYPETIATDLSSLGKVKDFKMEIELESNKPIYSRPYRLSERDRTSLRNIIDELLINNIIRESKSPFASPVLLIEKKGGEKRLCVDYRSLNKISIKEKYPMPRIEDLLDRLKGCKYFSSLDMKSGYYQLLVSENSIDKTAFITEDGHYEFLRMPFGLTNGPSVFQRMMNQILGNLRFKNVIVYLDDVLIVSETVEENINTLELVLKIFKQQNLTLNIKKCFFFLTNITFLGYEVNGDGIKPTPKKIEAIKQFPIPKTVHQLRQFLGLVNYFRKFIKDCAILSSPLTKLLKKGQKWQWSDEQDRTVNLLKKALTCDSTLAVFDPKKETILYTDASREGVAGILVQVHQHGERPVHYYSRQTTNEEKRYHSFELELLAIVASLQKFRLYLLGCKFKLVTDCNAVRYSLTKKEVLPRIARWVLLTQEFDYEICHRPGAKMQHVDALSRNPSYSGEVCEKQIIMSITEADWLLTVQEQDSNLVKIRNILLSGEADANRNVFNEYELLGNKVYRRTEIGRRWVVPKNCIWQVIMYNHDKIGHFAVDKTLERIKHKYWFPKMKKTVTKYIKNCLHCLYNKNKSGKKEGQLFPIPKYARPFHTLHMDHVGPFVKSSKGNCHILVLVDAFTKFVFVFPVRDTSTACVIKELDHLFKIFGNPRRLITDAGPAFTAKAFKTYCDSKNIRVHTIATGMPRSNGQVERYNKTLVEALRSLGADNDYTHWDDVLTCLQQGMNSTLQKTINAVPSEVFFGYRLRTESDIFLPEQEEIIDVTQLRQDIDTRIQRDAGHQKESFDAKRCVAKQYEIGDLVLVKVSSQAGNGNSTKLLPVYKGPFKITKILGKDRYHIVDIIGSERSHKKYSGTTCVENMKPWIKITDWDEDVGVVGMYKNN